MLKLDQLLAGTGFEGLGGIAKVAAERHQEKVKEQLTNSLIDVMGSAEGVLMSHVENVRAIRKSEKLAKQMLSNVAEAVEYLKATGNPMPFFKVTGNIMAARRFCAALGCPVPDADDAIWKVQPINNG